MKKRLKIILSLYIVILTSPMITIACPPDCGDCRYWDGDSCEYEGDCVDDGDCDSCEDCVDCYCELADGAECVDDDDCEDCEYCDYECECECATVSSISGISGPYCKGDSTTVTANLDYSASGCTIVWGGDASFSNQSGLTATATFNTTGENLKIWARTNCTPTYIKKYSSPFTVYELDSVTSDKASATLCEDIMFTAVTNPAGHGDDTQWSGGENPTPTGSGSTFTTSYTCIGQKTVTASLCDSNKPKNVTINLPSGCSECTVGVPAFPTPSITEEDACNQCPANKAGIGSPSFQLYDHTFTLATPCYDGCKWYALLDSVNTTYGICRSCPDNPANVCCLSDVSGMTQQQACEQLSKYPSPLTIADTQTQSFHDNCWCRDCITAHEESHMNDDWIVECLQPQVDAFVVWCDLHGIDIDCSVSTSTDCATVLTTQEKAFYLEKWVDLIEEALDDWENDSNPEDDADAAVIDCYEDIINALDAKCNPS